MLKEFISLAQTQLTILYNALETEIGHQFLGRDGSPLIREFLIRMINQMNSAAFVLASL